MRPIPTLLLFCAQLSACSGSSGDWRADAIASAEARMHGLVNDPAATFSHVTSPVTARPARLAASS